MLKKYDKAAFNFKECTLHGDDYFNKIDSWINDFALGDMAPRNEKLIK